MSPLLRNDNGHTIYFGDDAAPVGAGATFEGSDEDAKRPGVSKVSKAEADRLEAEARGEAPVTSEAGDAARQVAALSGAANLAGTAALRGELPYQRENVARHSAGAITTEDLPPTALEGHLAAVDEAAHAESLGAEPASSPASGDVEFATARAEERANELGLSATDLAPGQGSGADGAYTVKDLEAHADAE